MDRIMDRKIKDITGRRFGKLVAIKISSKRYGKKKNIKWYCKCDCGKTVLVSSYGLCCGNTKSCGCSRIKDITGLRSGKLVAIKPTNKRSNNSCNVIWLCKCDCGKTTLVASRNLQNKQVKSCGCLLSETFIIAGKTSKATGMSYYKARTQLRRLQDGLSTVL